MTRAAIPSVNEVQIRFTLLTREAAELVSMERLLAPAELARAARLRNRQARDRFVAGRGFLRVTLAAYLGVRPEDIRLSEEEHGKPRLAAGAGYESLSFNLSHADDRLVLAVARSRRVGIDMERMEENLPFRQMARITFSPRERGELFSLPPGEQLAAFYRCWTRKEAYLKGCGRGFSVPVDSFDVSLLPGHPPLLLEHRASPGEPAAWSLIDIPVPHGYFATLAVEGDPPVIRSFPWV
ncbi:MAG TPA: 4'-phosphopantetheinyl transferase superfamily protein [Geobacteraceae bacterium]|nr:4'-phosphopantetheinyl transferase superfamily protein [Geobacteraceae bacterium]